MSDTAWDNQTIYAADSFVSMPDMNCSFFILQNENDVTDEGTIIFKLDSGLHKNVVVGVTNLKFESDESTVLTFDYNVKYNPHNKTTNTKKFESIVKGIVKKILNYAMDYAEESLKNLEKENQAKKKIQSKK